LHLQILLLFLPRKAMAKKIRNSATLNPAAGKSDGSAEVKQQESWLNNQGSLLKAGALQSAIFNSANFSCIATDSKDIIQIFNVGAERMLGYTSPLGYHCG
jgi:PAS domain-containing protein